MTYCVTLPCGLCFIPQMVERSNIRFQRKIGGSCCGDCFQTACCPCCVLVQEEKEELENSAQIGQPGYQSQQQPMVYSQPQQQRPAARHHLSETLANDFTKIAVAGMNSGN